MLYVITSCHSYLTLIYRALRQKFFGLINVAVSLRDTALPSRGATSATCHAKILRRVCLHSLRIEEIKFASSSSPRKSFRNGGLVKCLNTIHFERLPWYRQLASAWEPHEVQAPACRKQFRDKRLERQEPPGSALPT